MEDLFLNKLVTLDRFENNRKLVFEKMTDYDNRI